MDGYAVRLADVPAPGATLAERPGLVAAGDAPGSPLGPGEAVRVMTGAPLPPGTEAVVPVEEIQRQDGTVIAAVVPRPGEHVRRRGESVAAGTVLLPPREAPRGGATSRWRRSPERIRCACVRERASRSP